MIADLAEKELQRRLNLYQVFLKLYEHHAGLLDEILQLENLDYLSSHRHKAHYVQGVIDTTGAYLITNLGTNHTQKLQQTQQIWTIGRIKTMVLPLRINMYHGVMQLYNI